MGNRLLALALLGGSAPLLALVNLLSWLGGGISLPSPPKQSDLAPAVGIYLKKEMRPRSDYENIVAANLFNAERREYIPPPQEAHAPSTNSETPPGTPDHPMTQEPEIKQLTVEGTTIVLHGILLLDGIKKALITNPSSGEKQRPTIWVKKNDTIADLKVEEILADRIVMQRGADRFLVLLRDPGKYQEQEKNGAASRPDNKPQQQATQPTVVTTTPAPAAPTGATPAKKAEDDGYITVQTPFGTIKKPK